MQNLTRRRLIAFSARWFDSSKIVSNNFLHCLSLAMCARAGFSSGGQGMYEERKISSYENLISQIQTSNSMKDVLEFYEKNKAALKNEHLVLVLRVMARNVKSTQQSELDLLPSNTTYLSLIQHVTQ